MTLTTKGSRHLIVDEQAYRWTIRRKPTYAQECLGAPMTLAVEHVDTGSVLVVTMELVRPDGDIGERSGPVAPARISRLIRASLVAGWIPSKMNKPYLVNAADVDA